MRFLKLLTLLMMITMTGCQVQPMLETPTRLPAPQTLTAPSEPSNLPTLSPTQIPPSPMPSSTPLPLLTATPIPMPSPTALPLASPSGGPPEPTPAATQIAPFVQGASIGSLGVVSQFALAAFYPFQHSNTPFLRRAQIRNLRFSSSH